MAYSPENGDMSLSGEQTEKVLQFQDLTGIEDMSICRDVLQRHNWNLEVAVQEQLNIREGRPSVYASESRPPALITKRILGIEQYPRVDPIVEITDFISSFEEKYGCIHPVFYQGTFSQVMNDAKRELRFLAVYLHDEDATDTPTFCRDVLSNPEVVRYVNNNFLFWGCNIKSGEGRKTVNAARAGYFPFVGILVLKENRMTIVGRIEGYCDADLFLQRLRTVVTEFEHNLVQARANRYENSFNRTLRKHQDEAYLESLRADQEKERLKEERRRAELEERRRIEQEVRDEEERRESLRREKIELVTKVPSEPQPDHPDAVHVVFKLPSGVRLERRFLKSHSLEHVFYFVFCHPSSPDTFEITTNFPKRVLKCHPEHVTEKRQTLEQAGLKNREVLFINDLDA